jgi:hypothetical protein
MRAPIAVGLGASIALHAAVLQAGQKDDRAARASERSAMIDQLARDIFAAADHNHNQLLSKREFAEAQEQLLAAVADLGRRRLIGNPKKSTAKNAAREEEKSVLANVSAEVSADKLAKSNKVSPAEFTFYVHSVVDAAERQWREINAAADAQAKAYNAQRRAYRPYRRYAYPYGFPYSY